jgi:transposase
MSKFIEGQDRSQGTLFPERLDDYVEEDSPVRVIDVFIDDLDILTCPSFRAHQDKVRR